jgi:hypothetical protein
MSVGFEVGNMLSSLDYYGGSMGIGMYITRVNVIKLTEKSDDFGYWKSQSYSNRLDALEEIRSEYISWKYGVKQEFQRIYRVTKLE